MESSVIASKAAMYPGDTGVQQRRSAGEIEGVSRFRDN
jgi:hypothetical protein